MSENLIQTNPKSGKHIIFLHATCSSSEVFEPTKPFLDPSYNLVSFNFEGHGNFKNADGVYSVEKLKKQTLRILNSLQGEKLVIGNSLGGAIALEIANEIVDLRGLALVGITPFRKPTNFEEALLPYEGAELFSQVNPNRNAVRNVIERITFNSEQDSLLMKIFEESDAIFREEFGKDFMKPNTFSDQVEILKTLKAEKAIFLGSHDIVVNANYAESLKDEIPNLETIIIPDCGHFPTLEKPQEFSEYLERIAQKAFG